MYEVIMYVGNHEQVTVPPGLHAHRQHSPDSFYLAALMTKLRA